MHIFTRFYIQIVSALWEFGAPCLRKLKKANNCGKPSLAWSFMEKHGLVFSMPHAEVRYAITDESIAASGLR
jgi:hypothetical protein